MFSTVSSILSWTLWTIRNIFLLFLLLCRLSWKLLLFLVFLDGVYKAIRALHKVCNIILEKSSHEKKKSDVEKNLNVLHRSSEDISVVSEMSSFNTNEEYVVESWNSYQVRWKTGMLRVSKSSRWFSEYFWRRRRRWGGRGLHRCLQDWECEWLGLVYFLFLLLYFSVCVVLLVLVSILTYRWHPTHFFHQRPPSTRSPRNVQLH